MCIRQLSKKMIAVYKTNGLMGVIKTTPAYIKEKYQLFFLVKIRSIGQKRRKRKIFYIDYFSPENSNFYWLKAFQKFGKVETFDIIREDKRLLESRMIYFKPTHIHLGGSVKNNRVSPQLLLNVKEEFGCTISVFYGDARYSSCHSSLAKVVDCIYVSNKTHIKINRERGLENFKYMPCPTDPDIFSHQECKKIYDIVFIGNNNQSSRLPLLKKLADNFNLMIFGNDWKETGLNYAKPVYSKEFSKVCSKAKICLGILDSKCTELEAYFSNRLVNTLATGSFYIQRYTPGLEKIFTNRKHLVWYTDEKELIELIKYYLNNEKERGKIAAEGQKKVYENYTYEKSIKRIFNDVKVFK